MPRENPLLRTGAIVMLVGALSFIGYAVVFFFSNFGKGFELGVDTLGGLTQDDLNAVNPAIVPILCRNGRPMGNEKRRASLGSDGMPCDCHIGFTAGFIASTGIAVAALAWYGVQRGEWWAWVTAVVSPVVALAVALPMHYLNLFTCNWLTHLGPIYLGTVIFVVGALIALRGLTQKRSIPD